jgi:hypothetical protein
MGLHDGDESHAHFRRLRKTLNNIVGVATRLMSDGYDDIESNMITRSHAQGLSGTAWHK